MTKDIREYIKDNQENILADIGKVVAVRSVLDEPLPGAPYGTAVRQVQDVAMDLCREYGFDEVVNLQDRIAYAHYGDRQRFLSVIAHLDVVPEGNGWISNPFELCLKDGYMVGRGVCDNKGPFILALWAIKYFIDNGIPLNYGLRLIIGLNEESGMSDIEYYNQHCEQALFTFTPDAEFPVCHGEKGLYMCDVISPAIQDGSILFIEGGVAHNVVPDLCTALLGTGCAEGLQRAATGRRDIRLIATEESIRVEATGIASHASMPEHSVNAIRVLFRFLLESGVLSEVEQQYIGFLAQSMDQYDGSFYGVESDDGLFSPLTLISGLVSMRDGCIVLNHDCRYPTNISGQEITHRITQHCGEHGFTVDHVDFSKPFYIPPDSPPIRLLCDIYNRHAGTDGKPFVISGGTYARFLDNAVSYGIEVEGVEHPDWVGKVHMKNEAVSVDHAMMSCEIFIEALLGLQELSFD